MAHSSSTPSNRRLKKPESPPNLDERWKTSPSTEVTSDQGQNARLARARKEDENTPRRRREPASPPPTGKNRRR
jgi:hypothetical protein